MSTRARVEAIDIMNACWARWHKPILTAPVRDEANRFSVCGRARSQADDIGAAAILGDEEPNYDQRESHMTKRRAKEMRRRQHSRAAKKKQQP